MNVRPHWFEPQLNAANVQSSGIERLSALIFYLLFVIQFENQTKEKTW